MTVPHLPRQRSASMTLRVVSDTLGADLFDADLTLTLLQEDNVVELWEIQGENGTLVVSLGSAGVIPHQDVRTLSGRLFPQRPLSYVAARELLGV